MRKYGGTMKPRRLCAAQLLALVAFVSCAIAFAVMTAATAFAQGGAEDFDKKIAEYTQTLNRNPNDAEAYKNRGNAYVMKEDYTHARADWEKALQLDPNNATARHNLEQLRNVDNR
jgi:tetratricopeptide (TPR) repeat protein